MRSPHSRRRRRTSPIPYSGHGCWSARAPCSRSKGKSAVEILGEIDAVKLRSSMTLFAAAAPDEPVFVQVLDRYFDGMTDAATERRL